jgi:hypothetical protein
LFAEIKNTCCIFFAASPKIDVKIYRTIERFEKGMIKFREKETTELIAGGSSS